VIGKPTIACVKKTVVPELIVAEPFVTLQTVLAQVAVAVRPAVHFSSTKLAAPELGE
jgi:hypothetical protein